MNRMNNAVIFRLQYSEAMEILEKNNEKFQCPVKVSLWTFVFYFFSVVGVVSLVFFGDTQNFH